MRWFGLVVAALAAYRATRFVTSDSITEPARDRLERWAWTDDVERGARVVPLSDGEETVVLAPRGRAWRTWAFELATCPWCLGVWISAASYCAWRWGGDTVARPVLVVLAIAGVQGFLASRADA